MADFPVPASKRPKLSGYDFYKQVLGSPKYVVAPMVDASELAWRLLSRRHGAELCYTPMLHSTCFVKDPKYRKDALQSCPEDRPLIIQFCGNNAEILLEASKLAQDHCDAIDINLGCPQAIAKRGHYGAFLQDEWDLLAEIVSTLHNNLLVPVTCKIRIFQDINKTIQYAQMLESSGCQLLTVHGRTREQKGAYTGIADWNYIKVLREKISIPLLSNGNIMSIEDINRCLDETKIDGIMTAEGNLHNPGIFEKTVTITWEIAEEYLNILYSHPAPRSYIRGHLFKIFHHLLNLKSNTDYREAMATSHTVDEFRSTVKELKCKYEPFHNGDKPFDEELNALFIDYNLILPPWICQPYIRDPPEEHEKKIEEKQKIADDPNTDKRKYFDVEGNEISRKKMKKLRRVSRRQKGERTDRHDELCHNSCTNPKGLRCEFDFCRVCCKNKCFTEILNCTGHKILIKTRFEKINSKVD